MARSTNEFKVGDKVTFGRRRGQKTRGTVVKVNPKRLKVRTDEVRGLRAHAKTGEVWNVPPSMCEKVGTDPWEHARCAPPTEFTDVTFPQRSLSSSWRDDDYAPNSSIRSKHRNPPTLGPPRR